MNKKISILIILPLLLASCNQKKKEVDYHIDEDSFAMQLDSEFILLKANYELVVKANDKLMNKSFIENGDLIIRPYDEYEKEIQTYNIQAKKSEDKYVLNVAHIETIENSRYYKAVNMTYEDKITLMDEFFGLKFLLDLKYSDFTYDEEKLEYTATNVHLTNINTSQFSYDEVIAEKVLMKAEDGFIRLLEFYLGSDKLSIDISHVYGTRVNVLIPEYSNVWEHNSTHHYRMLLNRHYEDVIANYEEHEFKVETIAPTKTEKGYDHHHCDTCSYSYNDNYVDPLG